MKKLIITETAVKKLITQQFPQWENLPIKPVAASGWDNRTFHLGDTLLVRLPSSMEYAAQVSKEQFWLPQLAPLLPLSIPTPVAMGQATEDYPCPWSIYEWLEGETVAETHELNLNELAISLAQFLADFHRINTTDGPMPGAHNFYRGGNLAIYNQETRQAITLLKNQIDVGMAIAVWETALASAWSQPPVWVHGDISAGNLLIKQGKLSAVIDFGGLAIGDPACDLSIAWTLLSDKSRELFWAGLAVDEKTKARARGWILWKALIVAAKLTECNNFEGQRCWQIIAEILKEHK